jgi:hypothetical protein
MDLFCKTIPYNIDIYMFLKDDEKKFLYDVSKYIEKTEIVTEYNHELQEFIVQTYEKYEQMTYDMKNKKIHDFTQEEFDYLIFNKKVKILSIECKELGDFNGFSIVTDSGIANFYELETLGSGSYGTVKKYTYNSIKYAVKSFVNPNDDEISIVKFFEKVYNCSVVNARNIICKKSSLVLMEIMDGDISDLMREGDISDENVVYIIDTLKAQIQCLLSHKKSSDLAYTDIKPENILYKYVNGNLRVKLGDLGSIVPGIDGKYIASYPCYYNYDGYSNPKLISKDRVVACTRYFLGILMARMSKLPGTRRNFDDNSPSSISMYKRLQKSIVIKYGVKYDNLLWDSTPEIRKTLYD